MQQKIQGEQPFQVLSTSFTIGPSSSGYDLYFSADGIDYTNLFTVGANVNRQVTQVAAGSYYKLIGNTDEVTINWILNCESGSGGGGGGYVLPPATQNMLGGVKIGSGVTVAADGTISVECGGGASYREFFINNMTDAERAELYTEIYTTLSGIPTALTYRRFSAATDSTLSTTSMDSVGARRFSVISRAILFGSSDASRRNFRIRL